MTETWHPVVGISGYQTSDHGNIRNTQTGAKLKPFLVSNNGNRQGNLAVEFGRGVRRRVHHVVLEAFVGPCPPGMIGLHYDDNPFNNHLSNLRWGTHSDNMYDMVRNGNHAGALKETCSKGHPLDGRWKRGAGYVRYCKTCRQEYVRDYKKRKREGGPINKPGRPRKT
jgi:hypothetical protein